jgi:hypothetical protein
MSYDQLVKNYYMWFNSQKQEKIIYRDSFIQKRKQDEESVILFTEINYNFELYDFNYSLKKKKEKKDESLLDFFALFYVLF